MMIMKKKLLLLVVCFSAIRLQAIEPAAVGAIMVGMWLADKVWVSINTSVFGNNTKQVVEKELLKRKNSYLMCIKEQKALGDTQFVDNTEIPSGCKELAEFYAEMCDKETRDRLFAENK